MHGPVAQQSTRWACSRSSALAKAAAGSRLALSASGADHSSLAPASVATMTQREREREREREIPSSPPEPTERILGTGLPWNLRSREVRSPVEIGKNSPSREPPPCVRGAASRDTPPHGESHDRFGACGSPPRRKPPPTRAFRRRVHQPPAPWQRREARLPGRLQPAAARPQRDEVQTRQEDGNGAPSKVPSVSITSETSPARTCTGAAATRPTIATPSSSDAAL